MYRTMQMEEFSRAYVKAIAAQAGYTSYRPEVDDDSIDIGEAGSGNNKATPRNAAKMHGHCR